MIEALANVASAEHAAPPLAPAVAVSHLSRRFGSRTVLRDVTFSLPPGFALGVAGANGAGKTVLMRLLATLDRQTSGSIRIDGLDTVRETQPVRRVLGYVAEEPMLYDGLSVRQYLDFVGRARGLGDEVRGVAATTLVQVVGLERRQFDGIEFLSPGERRRLALAGALIHEPSVLLLDDPLRGLDGYARLEQIEVLLELRRLGTTIVQSATRPEDILDVCDRIAVLRDGEITWEGDRAAAATLAAPNPANVLTVRAEILQGIGAAMALLQQLPDVSQLDQEDDGQTLWFQVATGRTQVADLLPQLLRTGCTIARFGVERRSSASALNSLLSGNTT